MGSVVEERLCRTDDQTAAEEVEGWETVPLEDGMALSHTHVSRPVVLKGESQNQQFHRPCSVQQLRQRPAKPDTVWFQHCL